MKRMIGILLLSAGWSVASLTASGAEIPIRYTLDHDAKISMVLYSPQGGVVRELLHAAPRKQGEVVEKWDGLDDEGKPVGAGDYSWKLLATQGLKSDYLFSVGTNATPSWEAWPGNHGPATTVAVDDDGVYLATGCGEGTILALKQSFDGKRLWTIPHWFETWCGPSTMACDGGQLFMLEINGILHRVDRATGEPNAVWDVGLDEDRKASVFGSVFSIMDLDAGAGQLVVSYQRQNLIRWLDPTSGKEIDRATISHPAGVAIDRADGSLLVISDGQVVRLSQKEKTPRIVIPGEKLNGARRLRVSPKSRDILVIENRPLDQWVERQYFSANPLDPKSQEAMYRFQARNRTPGGDLAGGHQVKRFSADGKLLAAYGSPTGHAYGSYNPGDFSGLWSIAATADGGFVIGEEDVVRRSALFDADGKFVREWFGGLTYGQHSLIDPEDPAVLWIPTGTTMLKTRIDVANKSWKMLASYNLTPLSDWFGQGSQYWKVLRRNGITYFARVGCYECLGPAILRVDEANGKLVLASVSSASLGQDKPAQLVRVTRPILSQAIRDRQGGSSFNWNDLDGNGEPSLDEFTFVPWYTHANGFYMEDDFTYYFHGQDDALKDVGLFKLPVKKWTPQGVPVYDFADRQIVAKTPLFTSSIWRNGDGSFYSFTNSTGLNEWRFGMGFWSARASANRVSKFSADGISLWTVGQHAAGTVAAPGEGKYLYTITGTAHDCVVVNDVEGSMMHVWDGDGLWVGRLLENPTIGPDSPQSAYQLCGENFGGSLYTEPKTGDVLFFGGGINRVPVYRITGWNSWERHQGHVEVSPQIVSQIQKSIQAEAEGNDVVRIPFMESRSVRIDGDLSEWKDVKPLKITDGKRTLAKVYLGWMRDGIVAAFDVDDDSPWASIGSEQLPFEGGAAVDINIGLMDPDPKMPGEGDMRVVVAPIGGKTVAVEMIPVLAQGMSVQYRKPATYKTMIGSITYERVGALQGKVVASTVRDDGLGYIVEVKIPCHPPFAFKPGARIRFDASVILSNSMGNKSASRVPWHSRSAGDMAVDDVFTEATLRPLNWGQAVLEK